MCTGVKCPSFGVGCPTVWGVLCGGGGKDYVMCLRLRSSDQRERAPMGEGTAGTEVKGQTALRNCNKLLQQ